MTLPGNRRLARLRSIVGAQQEWSSFNAAFEGPCPKKLLAEFLGTFWLVFCGCGSAVPAAAFPEPGIGSTGPALFVGDVALHQLWLFWVAPIVGAALAGFTHKALFKHPT